MSPILHKNKSNRTFHLLLVEDNSGDVALIQEIFKSSKHRIKITRARDGQEAMDYLKGLGTFEGADKPDLVLLDLSLPKKNGFEVLSEIKADPKLNNVPVVILSNSNLESDVKKAYEARANYYLVKPSGLEEFFTEIKKIEEIWLGSIDREDD